MWHQMHLPWTAPKHCCASPWYICTFQPQQGQLKTFPAGKPQAQGMCLLWHSASSSRGAQWGRIGSTVGRWDPGPALQAKWLVQNYQRWVIVTALKTFLKFLKIVFPNFSSQMWSAATAHPGLWWTMLSIWVQVLGWPGVTEPQVPSAKALTEPLINNLFFPFLLSFFQCQHHPACWWREAFYLI